MRTKSEILEALQDMPFDGGDLVASATQFSEALQDSRKATLRRASIPRPESLDASQIADLRKSLNLSQAVFAGFLGVRPASVMSWEYGRRRPSGSALRLLQIATRHPEVLLEVA
ncbi:MAG: type II toxin-antitoxin system MqsA family antitoxin [Verrucomicrobia bacterium]|nr:type II toxin-antitoxin system MqsA family antitoxin [Verrucomicrobiota bacterium]